MARALHWSNEERVRWLERVEKAAPGDAEAGRLGAELFRAGRRLGPGALRAEARRVSALYRLSRDAARAPADRAAVGAALAALRDGLEFESATGSVLDGPTGRLKPVSVFGAHVDLAPGFQFDHGAGLSSWVVKSRRPILLTGLRRDGDGPSAGRLSSFLSVPILDEDRVLGVLCLGHRRAGAFTPTDRNFLSLAGRLLGSALARGESAPEGEPSGAPAPEERLLALRVGEEERATRNDGIGFSLIGLRLDAVLDARPLDPPADLRHRVAEWARQTGGRETSTFALPGDEVVVLLPRRTPQATRRLAAELRQELSADLGAVSKRLRLATVLYPRDAASGPEAVARLRALLRPARRQAGSARAGFPAAARAVGERCA
jgi:hypothetical protein